MKKLLTFALAGLLMSSACTTKPAETVAAEAVDTLPNVYYIKDITPASIVKVYQALGREPMGKVGIKISTGESMKSNHLDTALIADFVRLVNGTFVECNTAYAGNRNDTERHLATAAEHGYTALAGIDIMDAEGDTIIPVGFDGHLKGKNYVGKHMTDYDFMVVLSHFKGHAMGGFGGALKNISIGIGSSAGKSWIHSAGYTTNPDSLWSNIAKQDDFLESMAEAAKSVVDYYGKNILYINVANRLSVDCDCNGDPEEPQMEDFGVLASLDPVALDQACVDMVTNSADSGKVFLIERINSRHGTHTIDHADSLKVGSKKYNLITITE